MSNTERNVAIVHDIYAAFGRKDIPAIIERLHPEVEWELGAMDHGVPWLTPGRGREHAMRFFQTVAALEFTHFSVHAVMGAGSLVVGLVHVEFVYPATGRAVSEPMEAHIWKIDDDGRVVGMRHAADTHQHWLALGHG